MNRPGKEMLLWWVIDALCAAAWLWLAVVLLIVTGNR